MLLQRLSCTFLIALLLATAQGRAQGVSSGSIVPTIPVERWLNTQEAPLPLAEDQLTVLDFFGTWCAPCLRALPHLTELQRTFAGKIVVILVANEKTAPLNKFLDKNRGFPLPIIVDSNDHWNSYFRPPALPFSVVLRGHRVLAISDAASLTANQIEGWLAAPAPAVTTTAMAAPAPKALVVNPMQYSTNPSIRLSQEYLYAAKTGSEPTPYLTELAALSLEQLSSSLRTDAEKKAFWINVYNGYIQATLKATPGKYRSRSAFFKENAIRVAGQSLSLDQIEHGFLRRSRVKWSLGYLGKPFPSNTEKKLRVQALDYRIHFALNCGARSCPPIAFYNEAQLDEQLDIAEKAYLSGESDYDSSSNTVALPKILSWFRADFGGKKGMRELLRKHRIVPEGMKPKIRFKDYDWTLTLNNYNQ